MKRLSHKDLIIALGVLVAVVVLAITLYHQEPALLNENKLGTRTQESIRPSALIKKILQKTSSKVRL